MCTATNDKTQLPLSPTPTTMELLIKAKHFLEHATLHAQTGNSFDSMIAIHSLDNSIEYMLRIMIKHLEIEEKTNTTLSSSELSVLFGAVDKFLKNNSQLNGKGIGLPYETEIKQLRVLRNNVQHGLILPISELRMFLTYGQRFFEKVLNKVFGLTPQEIAYSTLIENSDIKAHLITAETKIAEGQFLPAVVACRDAFELGKFLLCQNSHHYSKMAVLPHLKNESENLYWYIQSLEQEISILGTNINPADYRLYQRYVHHIPSEYRAIKSGYSVMQREWEKRDSDFCYSFVSQAILYWQMTQEQPLYEIDMSAYPVHVRDKTINGVNIPEIYPEKHCYYIDGADAMGELQLITHEAKEKLKSLTPGQICSFYNKLTNSKSGLMLREYTEYIIIDSCDFNLVLNNGPLWEFMMYYRTIPFTTRSDMDNEMEEVIDIDNIATYTPKSKTDEKFKSLIIEFGAVDTAEKAFRLNELLKDEEFDSIHSKVIYSSKLIDKLSTISGHTLILPSKGSTN